MKINEQVSLNQFFQGYKKPVDNLDQWLKDSQKKGDDYYWVHQHQLENSALQFNALNLETKDVNATIENENPAFKSLRKIEEKSTQQFLENGTGKFQDLQPEISKIKLPFMTGCPLASRNFSIAVSENGRSQHQQKLTDPINFLSTKILPRPFIFKEHQLFISKNEAELSLNGANLNRQEIKELVGILKKTFYNQGLKLEKLIINGETQ